MKYTIEFSGRGSDLTIGSITEDAMNYIEQNYGDDFVAYQDAIKSGSVPEEFIIIDKSSVKSIQDYRLREDVTDEEKESFAEEEVRSGFLELDDISYTRRLLLGRASVSVKNEDGDEVYSQDEDDLEDWFDRLDHGYEYEENNVFIKFEENEDDAEEDEEEERLNRFRVDFDSIMKPMRAPERIQALCIQECYFKGSFIGSFETDGKFDPEKLCLGVGKFKYSHAVRKALRDQPADLREVLNHVYLLNTITYTS